VNRVAGVSDIDIKVALEDNKPKGHLAKPCWYIAARYLLCGDEGRVGIGKSPVKRNPSLMWLWQQGSPTADSFHIWKPLTEKRLVEGM